MIKVENIVVTGFEAAARGMRNPLQSHNRSDSYDKTGNYIVGQTDLGLMKRLYKAGPEHAKYLRMIHLTMDVTAPLYWWKEADQYKIGTTTNSTSTMHKIHAKEFTLDDFSHEHLTSTSLKVLNATIDALNKMRLNHERYDFMSEEAKKELDPEITCKKDLWWQMIQLLPSSYNQMRTWDFDYQTAVTMIRQRSGHKLDEWNQFVCVLKSLPYMRDITED